MGACCSSSASADQPGPRVVQGQSISNSLQPSSAQARSNTQNLAVQDVDGEEEDLAVPQSACSVCKAIPFRDLPHEDDLGYPHQPSLQALKTSARTCMVCRLILCSVNYIRDEINVSNPGWRRYHSVPLGPDRARMETAIFGQYYPGSFAFTARGTTEQLEQPEQPEPSSVFAVDTAVRPYLFGNWWRLNESGPVNQLVGLGVRVGATGAIEDGEGNVRAAQRNREGQIQDSVYLRGTLLRIRVRDDSPSADFIPGRLRTQDSASSIAFDRIQHWLDTCDNTHTCWPYPATPLPTRVLDLGQGFEVDVVQLFESSGELDRFVALSHRWGASPRMILTRETFDEFKRGIASADLPKTFRDAARITKELGLRYLWIDCLCIIQNDEQDWENEASRMAGVYANAYVTIAASASEDDSTGVFPTPQAKSEVTLASPDAMSLGRSPMFVTPMVVPANEDEVLYASGSDFALFGGGVADPRSELCVSVEWMPSSTASSPQTYSIPAFGRPIDPPMLHPLNSRGWTLQERILSRRTLHYSADQIYWECDGGILSEDGAKIKSTGYNFLHLLRTQQIPLEEHGLGGRGNVGITLIEGQPPVSPNTTGLAAGRWRGGWLSTIEEYSARKFTRNTDKLPALSGVAQLLSSATDDAYYAGLWRSHILEDLHWRVYAREERRIQVRGGFAHDFGEQLCTPMRPAEYRAPTWSWASIDATVKFIPLDFERILTTFIDCHVTPAGSDPFGKVSGAWVKLKGPLKEILQADASFQPDPQDPLGFGVLSQLHLPHGISYGEAFFDLEPHFPCSALFLDTSNALLLAPSQASSPVFVRIGIAKFLRTDSQRKAMPLASTGPFPVNEVPYGPITVGGETEVVII